MKAYNAEKALKDWSAALVGLNEFELGKLRPIFEAACKGETAADFFEGSLKTPAYTAAEVLRLSYLQGFPQPEPVQLSASSAEEKLKALEPTLCDQQKSASYARLISGFLDRFGYDSPAFPYERLFTVKAALAAQWAAAALSVDERRREEAEACGRRFNSGLLSAFGEERERAFLSIVLFALNQAALCHKLYLSDASTQAAAMEFRRVFGCGGITPPLK